MESKLNTKDWTSASSRMEYIRTSLGYEVANFVKKTGCALDTYNKMLDGTMASPTLAHMKTTIEIFPINSEWMFSGEGKPFIEGTDLKKYKFKPMKGMNAAKSYVNSERIARFVQIRTNNGMSQVLLANKLDTSRDTISAIENGRQEIPAYIMEKLHTNLNVDLNWLMCGTGDSWKYTTPEMLDEKRLMLEETIRKAQELM